MIYIQNLDYIKDIISSLKIQFKEKHENIAMANRILYHPANLIMYHIERRSSFLSLFI